MKTIIKSSLALWIIMGLVSACSQKSETVQSEAVVQALSKSVFNPGETVSQAGTLALLSEPLPPGTDGGYIAPPDQSTGSTGSSGEGGNIPAPGDSSGTTAGGQTDSGNVSNGTTSGATDTGSLPGSDSSSTSVGSVDSGSIGQAEGNVSGSTDTGVVPPPVDPGTVAVDDSGNIIKPMPGGTNSGSADSGSVAQNGGSSGGSSDSQSGSCTNSGVKPSPKNSQLKFQLRRACSIKRSNSKSLFFEEAKNPIFTIEAVNNSGFLAMPGFYQGSKAFSLVSVPLKDVDLMKGKYSGLTSVALAAFKKSKGVFWGSTYLDIKVCEDSNKNGFCYDEPVGNQLAIDVPDLKAGSIPKSLQINVFSGRSLTKSENPRFCETQYSPLVMDLSGNGFDFIGPESGVSFDIDDSGSPIPTGWIYSKDDALLVRDLNANRKIESGAELFGNATKLPTGQRAINGFEALRPLDSDANGLITSKDKAWTELKLWVDINHDGTSQQRELMSLDRAGVESISLAYASVMEVDRFGNQTRERSTFVRRVRSKRYVMTVSDVWFNSFVSE
ncbi:MAG: hypothetical protein EBQ92_14155 [Proteobacteria bacterium]|nr:hypothetical protein [Pseudomonadota bacterium]